METLSKYFVLAALAAAAVGIGLIIFIVIQRGIYKDQLEGVNKHIKTAADEIFDWKSDDFEKSFTLRFTVPTIILMIFCVLALAFSVLSVVFKYCSLS